MKIHDNVPLADYSAMRLGGEAAHLVEITTKEEVPEALAWAKERGLPVIMIGVGSNIFWRDEGFDGLILVNKIKGFETYKQDDINTYITVGAGENWDEVVKRTVDMGLSGIEQLSLIPGTAGATPVQNVGAYGKEIADVLVTVEAFDTIVNRIVMLRGSECYFGYRDSRFKSQDRGRFFITAITLHLTTIAPMPPFYASLQTYLDDRRITEYTPAVIRDAVIAIRSSKLPDPKQVANNGSFFQNPIIPSRQFAHIKANHPAIPHWPVGDDFAKIPAAWLLEQTGFKDYRDNTTGFATWPEQPIVIINEHATSTDDLITFREKIINAVQNKFGITLRQEPELLP